MNNSPKNTFTSNLRTVFIDRDGVINRKMPEGHYVTRPDEFEILPGVPEAILALNQAGLLVLVVSNQRGIALGFYTTDDVTAIHKQLSSILAHYGAHIDGFYFCPHDNNQCDCRKPGTGLFEQAMREFPSITPQTSIMIGDSLSDIEAGQALGMATIFIAGDPERRKPGAEKAAALAGQSCTSLQSAVSALLVTSDQLANFHP
jgi:D-glycero-D-manno-heptose 1,7-bisphosphate phosphatase